MVSRADAGIPRLTQRDVAALEHLEEMRGMWEPDVARLLALLAGRDGSVSPTAVRSALRRWQRLSLVKVVKMFAHEPRLVWLTETGAHLVGARYWREPGVGVLRHTAEVARVREWLEGRGIAGQRVVEWVSERRWRQAHVEAIKQGAHVPDGIAVTEDGTNFAVEVELSDKGPSRTMDIAMRLTRGYAEVIYVVPEGSQTARTVNGAMERALAGELRGATGPGRCSVLALPARVRPGGEQG